MQYKFHTRSGSVYVHTVDTYGDTWHKVDRKGGESPLAGAVHLTRRRLQELITDYPIAALARTAFLSVSVAKEFFDDVEREGSARVPETEESAIFFLIDRGEGRYNLGYSSRVEKIEAVETIEQEEKSKIHY